MCVNYIPPSLRTLVDFFHVDPPEGDWKAETYKDYAAPFIIADGNGGRCALVGNYGMVPRRKIPEGVKPYDTMNARLETIGEKRSYKGPWHRGMLCLVPCMGFFEPCYETGKAVRWQIGMADGAPFAVAGLWRPWKEPDGRVTYSFTQITVNADRHPLLRRMHKPGDEKRSLVILPEALYDDWLNCKDPELARNVFGRLYPAELMRGWPDPKNPGAEVGQTSLF